MLSVQCWYARRTWLILTRISVTYHTRSRREHNIDPSEIAEIDKQDPQTKNDGGYQGLMVSLQSRINRATGDLHLTADDLRRIPMYAFDYKNGGWEDRLIAAFSRTLGPRLGR